MPRHKQIKVSQWLSDYIQSHGIYQYDGAADSFAKETGENPVKWPTHKAKDTLKAIEERGLGGHVKDGTPSDELQVWGWELAAHLARQFGNDFISYKIGRGGIFYDCVAAIKRAGN